MASNYRNSSSKKPRQPKKASAASPSARPQSPDQKMGGRYQSDFRHPSGREYNRMKANVISAHRGICHLCEHPGAQQLDHLDVFAETQNNAIDNYRPAHGSAGKQQNPCPVCGLNCNNIRGALSVEAAKAKIQRRIAAQGGIPAAPEIDEGREW